MRVFISTVSLFQNLSARYPFFFRQKDVSNEPASMEATVDVAAVIETAFMIVRCCFFMLGSF